MHVNCDSDGNDSNDPETQQEDAAVLLKSHHAKYVMSNMMKLPRGMVGQDGGHPWFLFWNTQSLQLLQQPNLKLDDDMASRCVDYLRQCHNPEEGGFRGAPYIMSHVASTYAAVMAIVNIGTKEAYDLVDLQAMKKYLLTVKNNFKPTDGTKSFFGYKTNAEFNEIDNCDPSKYVGTIPGGVSIHLNGEMDIRGVYCSLVSADVLGLLDNNKPLTDGIGEFLLGC